MPACFQLIDRTTKEPMPLNGIDDKMRQFFGAEPDSKNWFHNWYSTAGFCLATGQTVAEIKERWQDDELMVAILAWIDENYTVDCWHER
jgi:hypothetical protein